MSQPKSAAFAKQLGAAEPENLLLPRSTGLLYSLRTLSTIMPDLVLYDLTIGYPGMSVGSYAQGQSSASLNDWLTRSPLIVQTSTPCKQSTATASPLLKSGCICSRSGSTRSPSA